MVNGGVSVMQFDLMDLIVCHASEVTIVVEDAVIFVDRRLLGMAILRGRICRVMDLSPFKDCLDACTCQK